MDIAELRKMPAAELHALVEKRRKEIFQLRFKAATEPITDPGAIRRARKEIARVFTILRERELSEAGTGGRRFRSRAARKEAQRRKERLARLEAKKQRQRSAGSR